MTYDGTRLIASRPQKWNTPHTIFSVLLTALFAYAIYIGYENIAVKKAWVDLAAAAHKHAGDLDVHAPVIVGRESGTNYVVLGVPSGSRIEPFEWIILDATPDGLVMRNPVEGHFVLTCSYLAELTSTIHIELAVHKFLAARCRH